MKHPGKKWQPSQSPWLTRAEAADYLRWSVRTVDRYLVSMRDNPEKGKIRFETQIAGSTKKIRLFAQDVYAICPIPEVELKIAI